MPAQKPTFLDGSSGSLAQTTLSNPRPKNDPTTDDVATPT